MTNQVSYPQPGRGRLFPDHVSQLLERYPNVSGEETRNILIFLRDGRYLDVGVVTGNARLKPKLDAFLKDHWIHFHARSGRGDALVAGLVLILFLLWTLWAATS